MFKVLKNLFSFGLLFFCTIIMAKPAIAYRVSMDTPHTHYFDVEMQIEQFSEKELVIKMPVWTPGSYLVREFSRKVESFTAFDELGRRLPSEKTLKNAWKVQSKGSQKVLVKYRVYSFELSVRTCYLDSEHATIYGASLFMYVEGMEKEPLVVRIKPYKSWSNFATALDHAKVGNEWVVQSPNYDMLVDSPMEVGNHEKHVFDAGGVAHELVLVGGGNYDAAQMIADIQKIVPTEAAIFGEHPCKKYVVFNYSTESLYGGLEHLNCCSLTYPRWDYQPSSKYGRWQGLMSHEYFHLWNVKRLRPLALGPFDYDNENYTHGLWISEGTTSYYDDLVLRRAGLLSVDAYLGIVAENINGLESKHGHKVQSVAESSWDAWIKYYRPDENSDNCSISYYQKGAVLTNLLDLEIMHQSNGERSFDDVLRKLYVTYYKEKGRGFSDEELQKAVEEVAGVSLQDFFERYVFGTDSIDYGKYFAYAGLECLPNLPKDGTKLSLGIATKVENGRLIVTKTFWGQAGYEGGLNVNDELIGVDNYRVNSDSMLETLLGNKKAGDVVELIVSRSGVLKTLKITVDVSKHVPYKLVKGENLTELQAKIHKKWLSY